jgi:FtsP/CotA-like multicopper oxidase with cupredoxin domain
VPSIRTTAAEIGRQAKQNSFELTDIAGTPTAGLLKDVAVLGGNQTMDTDFVADQPALALPHCHSQLHKDFGFMALFHCA